MSPVIAITWRELWSLECPPTHWACFQVRGLSWRQLGWTISEEACMGLEGSRNSLVSMQTYHFMTNCFNIRILGFEVMTVGDADYKVHSSSRVQWNDAYAQEPQQGSGIKALGVHGLIVLEVTLLWGSGGSWVPAKQKGLQKMMVTMGMEADTSIRKSFSRQRTCLSWQFCMESCQGWMPTLCRGELSGHRTSSSEPRS